MRVKRLLSALALLFIATFGMAYAGPANGGVTAIDPYLSEAPPGATNAAAYMEIRNSGGAEVTLVKVSSPVSRSAELHTHVHENGLMRMLSLKEVVIQVDTTFTFEPGAHHIMLIGLKRPIKTGDTVPITLTFEDGNTLTIDATVRRK